MSPFFKVRCIHGMIVKRKRNAEKKDSLKYGDLEKRSYFVKRTTKRISMSAHRTNKHGMKKKNRIHISVFPLFALFGCFKNSSYYTKLFPRCNFFDCIIYCSVWVHGTMNIFFFPFFSFSSGVFFFIISISRLENWLDMSTCSLLLCIWSPFHRKSHVLYSCCYF